MPNNLTPCVKWTEDGGTLRRYNGRLLSIFSHYGNSSLYEGAPLPFIAYAAIRLDCGPPGPDGEGSYVSLLEKFFSGPDEVNVKRQVEEWVQQKFDQISYLLSHLD